MDIQAIVTAIIKNLFVFDWVILVAGIGNAAIFYRCLKNADLVYTHFNKKDYVSNLADEQKDAFGVSSHNTESLTPQKLLEYRDKTNSGYSLFLNITSVFPLLGMLGTVMSLISMGDQIGTEVQGAFFSALTSTFWGIVCAIAFKGADSWLSYKIDDNEKHLEYLFNPKKGEQP